MSSISLDYNRLLVKVAWLYYEHNMTQLEIAKRLRLSRQKVQRLLHQARNQGIVRISVQPAAGVFSHLEEALEQRFGLREAVVVETTDYDDQPTVAREVGAGAAEYLLRVIQPHDKIVISWGGSLLGMVNAVSANPPKEVESVMVIQGLGGIVDPNHEAHAADLTRRLAKFLGAQAILLPAPGVAGSRGARDAFYSDLYVAEALQRARTANLAFMGIGVPRQDSILMREGSIVSWSELTELMERGAVGDINLRYFDECGQMIPSELDDRVIGLSLDEIKQIDNVVGVAGGSVKLKAIRGALKGKLVGVLVTDHITAQRLLEGELGAARKVS
jgi:DNA-binding transcriptional regulator LsrR (DeoR family)